MPQQYITIKGAREHNLKDIDVKIPRDRLVVITGLSGSGKSSLAFDTIYAEGQRRYVESLSAYARQFLGQMEKPDVDQIDGLSPAVSIDQKGATRNPRSTVGTVTEIYDHLRLLFARAGRPFCPKCGRPIQSQWVQQIVDQILALPDGTKLLLLAPLVKDRKGEHGQILATARRSGYARARIDGVVTDLSDDIALDKMKKHSIDVVVDRLVTRKNEEDAKTRVTDSVETALRLGEGVLLANVNDKEDRLFSQRFACPYDGTSIPEIEPRTFSFNSPHGACPACTGLGVKMELDPELVVANADLSIDEGAILPWQREGQAHHYRTQVLEALAKKMRFSLKTPWDKLPKKVKDAILYGVEGPLTLSYENRHGQTRQYEMEYEGVIQNLERRYRETTSDYVKQEIERFMTERPCPTCGGARLRPEALAVKVVDKSIVEVSRMSVGEAIAWVDALPKTLSERERAIARMILKEIRARLGFLVDVGLDYLTLERNAPSLSGGEAQRIRLATQIGSGLMGVIYILDEPSIALHQRDNARLIRTLLGLRDIGNTVIVVEHDEETIRTADWIVDIGPGAGKHGGEIVAEGPLEAILAEPRSITGQYLSGRRRIPFRSERRALRKDHELVVRGASEHNLKHIDVRIPLGLFVAVAGLSGPGESDPGKRILCTALARRGFY